MEESGFLFLALLILGALCVSPILALIAWSRSREIGPLNRRVADLESRLELMQKHRPLATAGSPAAAPQPVFSPEPGPPPGPAPGPAPASAALPPPPPRPPIASPPPAARPVFMELPPASAAPVRASIDWERLLGLRGAALLGACVLALAGLLLFQYSIQHGLLSPALRVALGTLAGLGCLIGAEWLRSRRYEVVAEALAAAGIVILYAAFWAAHMRYALIPLAASFALMALVTLACCLLTLKHGWRLVIMLGLAGGFATPLVLSSDTDHPIGLFGYVLLLDLGLLAVGRGRRWAWLALLALGGTTLIQGLWLKERFAPGELGLSLGMLGVFALLFTFWTQSLAGEARRDWIPAQAAGLLVPFLFLANFGARVDLGPHLLPIAILLALLLGAAGWVGRSPDTSWMPVPAAAGVLGVAGLWIVRNVTTAAAAWETAALCFLLAGLAHLFSERDRARTPVAPSATAAVILSAGLYFVSLAPAAMRPVTGGWPWLALWLGLAALLWRQSTVPGLEPLSLAPAAGFAAGMLVLTVRYPGGSFAGLPTILGLQTFIALLFGLHARARKREIGRSWAWQGAALVAIMMVAGLSVTPVTEQAPALPLLFTVLLTSAVGLVAAERIASPLWFGLSAGSVILVQTCWAFFRSDLVIGGAAKPAADTTGAMLAIAAGALLFTLWPLAGGWQLARRREAIALSALAAPAAFPALRHLWWLHWSDAAIGLLPIALGTLSIGALIMVWRLPADEAAPARRTGLVWFPAAALCFVSVAIPLQLEKEWITIGWALQALAVILLWRRMDHAGLKMFALALFLAVFTRLAANPFVLSYWPRSEHRIVNWLLYTYLVPVGALLIAGRTLTPLERERLRQWELSFAGRITRPVSGLCGLLAILIFFAWLNLAIADWFSTGDRISLLVQHTPAQDLTLSVAWGVYALLLLGLGMARNRATLRWLSLGFLVLTIGKVFLYDLGELRDLYRVASLTGLAVSLMLVSLLYQRFVFRQERGEAS